MVGSCVRNGRGNGSTQTTRPRPFLPSASRVTSVEKPPPLSTTVLGFSIRMKQ
jgi:hypothetical protein